MTAGLRETLPKRIWSSSPGCRAFVAEVRWQISSPFFYLHSHHHQAGSVTQLDFCAETPLECMLLEGTHLTFHSLQGLLAQPALGLKSTQTEYLGSTV